MTEPMPESNSPLAGLLTIVSGSTLLKLPLVTKVVLRFSLFNTNLLKADSCLLVCVTES